MTGQRKRGFLRPGADAEIEDAKSWGLPDYSKERAKEAKPTAFNYDPAWNPDAIFAEDEEQMPIALTDEELEQIRRDAYQQGLMQGQEAGFNQGYEKGKEQGYQDGMAEGTEAGHKEGLEQGQQVINEHVTQLINLANQFAQPLELMNAQVERQLVDMVIALVKEITHVEVATNAQIILDTIRASVEVLPISGHDITLKLNPEDVAIIRQSYGEEDLTFRNWTVVAEPALDRGDVQIEASESSISYRMEDRIQSVLSNFCGTNRHKVGDSSC